MTIHDLFSADITIERDIPYRIDGDPRQKLDLYAPRDASGLPVAIYFYGGGWRSGDKRLFEHLGRALAVRGIITVAVNYRLTPAVRHPAHAEDCAAAVAWTEREIKTRGGDPERIFLIGHSAGAHLAALITVDDHFLRAAGFPMESIRGTVMISGASDLRVHAETTVFTRREYIEEAFGDAPESLADASPATHLHPGLPPFLIIVAENDPPGLRKQGKDFADALRDAGGEALYISVKGRDHFSIIRRFGPSDDATAGAIVDFIRHYQSGRTSGPA
ncbi:MAG: alpha/beta hydrolase [Bacteroidota bacterium]